MSEYRQITEDEAHAMFEIGQEVFWSRSYSTNPSSINHDIYDIWPINALTLVANGLMGNILFWVEIEHE